MEKGREKKKKGERKEGGAEGRGEKGGKEERGGGRGRRGKESRGPRWPARFKKEILKDFRRRQKKKKGKQKRKNRRPPTFPSPVLKNAPRELSPAVNKDKLYRDTAIASGKFKGRTVIISLTPGRRKFFMPVFAPQKKKKKNSVPPKPATMTAPVNPGRETGPFNAQTIRSGFCGVRSPDLAPGQRKFAHPRNTRPQIPPFPVGQVSSLA